MIWVSLNAYCAALSRRHEPAEPGRDEITGRAELSTGLPRAFPAPAGCRSPAERAVRTACWAAPQTGRGALIFDVDAVGLFSRRDRLATIAALLLPPVVCAGLVPLRATLTDTDAALGLAVVAVAAVGNRLAGYLATASAAVWFDFFLAVPY